MALRVIGGVLQGVEAIPIEVEIDLLKRLPRICIVGLAASAVKESAERVRSAIVSSGIEFPKKRVVVNLAPADVRKEGTGLDLPIAIGILAGEDHVPMEAIGRVLAVGELGLGGELRAIRGALSLALLAKRLGLTLLLPRANAHQAALVPDVDVVGADSLGEILRWLRGEALIAY